MSAPSSLVISNFAGWLGRLRADRDLPLDAVFADRSMRPLLV